MKNLFMSLSLLLCGCVVSYKSEAAMGKQTVLDFVAAINEHNVDKIYALMAEGHSLIDAQGNEVSGKDKVKAGWKAYFEWFPDYKIDVNTTWEEGGNVAVFGYAGGSYHGQQENHWLLPASWRAVVEKNHVKVWQVYADTKIPFDIIARNSEQLTKHDTTPRITGIGGVFFKCKDPNKVKEWYKTHLGLNTDQYGTTFEWREAAGGGIKKGFTQWSPFKETTKYFEPSTKEFMLNYRVQNIEGLVEKLKKDGVTVTDSIETFEYGKFVHIMDLEGNKIELWQADDAVYDRITTGARTK